MARPAPLEGTRLSRLVGAAALAGFALTILCAIVVAPDYESYLNDQVQYQALARGLVERGELTRATGDEAFIPETNRLAGYPLLLAPLCLGGCDHFRIAVAQGLLVGVLVLTAFALARRVLGPRAAALAAAAVALYVPFAYYGALALSDLPGAVLVALGVHAWLRGRETGSASWGFAAGALFGWAALMRGSLAFLPVALVAIALVRDRRAARLAAATLAALALVFAPYVAYAQSGFGRPVGANSGTVMWIGVFQFRTEASLDAVERAEAAAARAEIAAFDAMTDRHARALAWLALDDSLGRRARTLIAHDPGRWLAGLVPRSLELWAGDRPLRAPIEQSVAIGSIHLVLLVLGLAGALALRRRGEAGAVFVLVIAYVWLVAAPFQTEGRYSLPAKPFLIVAAVAALDLLVRRRRPAR